MRTEKLTDEQTAQVCRGFALLLHAGIQISESAYLLAREQEKDLFTAMGEQLDRGERLSGAMENSGMFPAFAVGLVRVGEQTGRLEEALSSLAAFYEERHRTRRQIRGALMYPCVILGLLLVVIGVLLVQVLPVFDGVYRSMGSRLTGIGAGLLYFGQGLKDALPVLLVLLCILALSGSVYSFSPSFRSRTDALLRRRFGDRGIAAKFNNARFARGLAMGLGSGLALEEAAELSRNVLEAPGALARCDQCIQALSLGAPLTEALGGAKLLSAADCRMLAAGERSGSSDRVMEAAADRMMEEAREALDTAVSRIEPAMVLVCSILVGTVLLAVMLPLMNILSAIG